MDTDLPISLNCRHATELPSRFPESLVALDLSFNKLSMIPALLPLKSLLRLDLSNNHLTSIEGVGQCYALQELNLAANLLRTVHDLNHLADLARLNLENNLIQTVADIRPLSFNSKLKVLVLKDNPVAALKSYKPTINSILPGLQMLDYTRRTKLNATFARVSTAFFSSAIETAYKQVRCPAPPVVLEEPAAQSDDPILYRPRSQAELGRVKRALRTVYYFSDLPADYITALLQNFFLISFEANETLITARSLCECLIIVLSGELTYKGKRHAPNAKLFEDGLFKAKLAEDDLTCTQPGEAILLTKDNFEQSESKCRGLTDMVRGVYARANIIPVEVKKSSSSMAKLAMAVSERLYSSVRKQGQPTQFSFSPNANKPRSRQSMSSSTSLKGSVIIPEEFSIAKEFSATTYSQLPSAEVKRPYTPENQEVQTIEMVTSYSPPTAVYPALYEELTEEMTTCKSTLCSLIVLSQDLDALTCRQTDNYRNILTECDLLTPRALPDLKDTTVPVSWRLNEMIEQSNLLKAQLKSFLEALEQRNTQEIVKLRFELICSRTVPVEKLPFSLQRIADFVDAMQTGRAGIERAKQPVGDQSF